MFAFQYVSKWVDFNLLTEIKSILIIILHERIEKDSGLYLIFVTIKPNKYSIRTFPTFFM